LLVLSVGRLIPLKRPHDLVRAAARVREELDPVRVVFVGAGPLAEELDTLARHMDVPVTFAGFRNQSELPPIYAAADLLALCSEWETWGLVVNEAMSCNLPVVVSDVAGCSADMIVPRETGLTYPAGDVAKLAGAIAEVASLRRAHDFAPALEAMCERFSCKAAADNTIGALHSVIGRMSG
jgi:glycosyltransferase involved in cell wall biosynthesis